MAGAGSSGGAGNGLRLGLAAIPAAAGWVSHTVLRSGNFRSSGLVVGISVSLGLVGLILLTNRPWRGRAGARRLLAVIPGLGLGLVALVGVALGLPEFLQARGL
ncbi:MAG: hypothetical protein WD532_00640, partial [Acidimicrobiia bacterium]